MLRNPASARAARGGGHRDRVHPGQCREHRDPARIARARDLHHARRFRDRKFFAAAICGCSRSTRSRSTAALPAIWRTMPIALRSSPRWQTSAEACKSIRWPRASKPRTSSRWCVPLAALTRKATCSGGHAWRPISGFRRRRRPTRCQTANRSRSQTARPHGTDIGPFQKAPISGDASSLRSRGGVRRRAFVVGLAGAAALPLAARAQQAMLPVIGFLGAGAPDNYLLYLSDRVPQRPHRKLALWKVENVIIEYGWAEGQYDRDDGAWRPIWSAVASRSSRCPGVRPGARAAMAATSTIPIVFSCRRRPGEGRPRQEASTDRKTKNATGINFFSGEVLAKQHGAVE